MEMKTEIDKATELILYFLTMNKAPISEQQAESFRTIFIDLLEERFNGHWYIEDPERGSAYRAITIYNGILDNILVTSFEKANIPDQYLYDYMPQELAIWVDPYLVSYRIGDNGGSIIYHEDRSKGKLAILIKEKAAKSIKVTIRDNSS